MRLDFTEARRKLKDSLGFSVTLETPEWEIG